MNNKHHSYCIWKDIDSDNIDNCYCKKYYKEEKLKNRREKLKKLNEIISKKNN